MKSERKAARIEKQNLVDAIQRLASRDDWRIFLETKGNSHKRYYHYTSLSVLRKIIGQDNQKSRWKIPCNSLSNDKTETHGHSVSFVTSMIGSVGMWQIYCPRPEDGVIIEFPHKIWEEVFITNPNLSLKKLYHPQATDIAYYHIGESKNGNLLYWQDIQLPENAMRWKFSDEESLTLPFLKRDIWRFERETRVFYERRSPPDDPLSLPIAKEQLKHLKFHLSPLFTLDDGSLFREKDHAEIVGMILPGQTAVTCRQFVFPREAGGVAFKKKSGQAVLKAIREKFRKCKGNDERTARNRL